MNCFHVIARYKKLLYSPPSCPLLDLGELMNSSNSRIDFSKNDKSMKSSIADSSCVDFERHG
ncbi:unnamed protein product [Heterobilharzia americana]|nr:unnamed protein product [Heterobilharzia americana]